MKIFTIGFAGKDAAQFFEVLRASGARRLLDVRVGNTSQLCGFTKKQDLPYLLGAILGITYHEVPVLAPTKEMLVRYRRTKDWSSYEQEYCALLCERQAVHLIDKGLFADDVVLLCSEPTAEKCHRRLAAETLAHDLFPEAEIVHL